MKKNMNVIGMIILITLFLLFYLVTNFFLGRGKENKLRKNIDFSFFIEYNVKHRRKLNGRK